MADPATEPQQSPESRLYAAGFTRRLDFWVPPGEDRALGLDDAVAMLDAGETSPPSWPGVHPDAVVGFQPRARNTSTGCFGRLLPPSRLLSPGGLSRGPRWWPSRLPRSCGRS